MQCDFCKCKSLSHIYSVPTSRVGAKIYSCDQCGLLQTIYLNKQNKHTNKSVSSGADWGNIRHGKKIRLQTSIEFIGKFVDLSKLTSVLDIGSNRGHFVNYLNQINSECSIVAVEPDSRILEEYTKTNKLKIINTRFEDYTDTNQFDFIYCCHTLEHADSANEMLIQAISLLKDDGHLFIDVPSASILDDETNVQEFFIDKHTYHFSIPVLHKKLLTLGLVIIDFKDDMHNITILCQKKNKSITNNQILKNYSKVLLQNHEKLNKVSKFIEELCSKNRVAVIGASKIYDALIKHANLNTDNIKYLIDDYLYGYIDEVHGKKIYKQEDILFDDIDIVILLTKSATDELKLKIKNKGISMIYTFDELILR